MAYRRRRIPGPAQRVGAPRLQEPRPRRFYNPYPGGYAVAGARGVPQVASRTQYTPPAPQTYSPEVWQRLRDAQQPGSTTMVASPPPAPPAPAPAAGALASQVPWATHPAYIEGTRGLEAQLAAALAGINSQRGLLGPQRSLGLERLGIQETEETRRLNEAENARGIYNSGIRMTDLAKLAQAFGQNREDIEFNYAQALSGLAGAEAEAKAGYQQGLAELLLGIAPMFAEDQSLGAFSEQAQDQARPEPSGTGRHSHRHGPGVHHPGHKKGTVHVHIHDEG